MSLTRQVGRVSRAVLGALAVMLAVNALGYGFVFFRLEPQVRRFDVGAQAIRQAHAAMVDQETGLRAYLLTGDASFLHPYDQGRASLARFDTKARDAFHGEPAQLARLRDTEAGQRAWTTGWAQPAMAAGRAAQGRPAVSVAFIATDKQLFDAYRAQEARAESGADRLSQAARARERRLLQAGLAVQLLLLVASALFVRRVRGLVGRRVVEPMQEMVGHIRLMHEGGQLPSAPREGPEELREIARGLDEMALALDNERARVRLREAELLEARHEAEAATAAKSAFLATMSHEIRTPMNAVIGMTGLLLEGELSDDQRDYAETVRNSGDALLVIINDILDFSKIESGALELESQPFSLRDCVESSLDLVAAQAAAKGLDLAGQLEPDVPVVVEGDVTRLRQVLVNLLINAVKFTAEGEVVLTVSVTDDDLLRFEVRDTGIGIPHNRMDRLFQSFSQVDTSTTRTYGGTGLGLAISARLTEAMNGHLNVESEEGVGSTFVLEVRLPRGLESEDRLKVVPAELPGRRVLVVDDNATNCRILRAQLEGWGMVVDDERDPRLGLQRAQTTHYDLAILDMHMPHLDGMMLASALRRISGWSDVPLVLLTSLGQRPAGSAELRMVHLTKPIKAMALRGTVARALGARQRPVLDGAEPERLGPLRVLLAEDNLVNQRVATLLLERLGQRPRVVNNGQEALQALHEEQFDVVLMDVQMPVLDGLATTRLIRAQLAQDRQPRIVAMTANAQLEDRERCFAAGMDDYLAKPVRSDELAEALRRVPPQYPGVDPSVLAGLTGRLGERGASFRVSLIGTWGVESAARVADLEEAARSGDKEGVARAAHSLKSSSGALGAVTLSRLCGRVEDGLRSGEERDLAQDAAAISSGVDDAAAAFAALWPPEAPVGAPSAG